MDNHFKIITPVYNADKYIKKCIDSLKAQVYKNFEVVIVNACSTDNTGKIIENEIKEDARFHLINNKVRQCALKNTVEGIHYLCKNDEDIIAIVDGDDWLSSPHSLEYLNKVYQNKDIWTTYGQFELLSTGKIGMNGNEYWCQEQGADFKRFWMRRFYFSQ